MIDLPCSRNSPRCKERRDPKRNARRRRGRLIKTGSLVRIPAACRWKTFQPAHECPANPLTGSKRVARLHGVLKMLRRRTGPEWFTVFSSHRTGDSSYPCTVVRRFVFREKVYDSASWEALYVAGVRSGSTAVRSNKTRDDLRSSAAASINFADG